MVSDRCASIQLDVTTSTIRAIDNNDCSLVAPSPFTGVPDACPNSTPDASTSQAAVLPFARGTWSITQAQAEAVPTLPEWATIALALLVAELASIAVQQRRGHVTVMDQRPRI